MVGRCIDVVQSARKSRGFLNNNAAFVTIGLIVQPVGKRFQPIPFLLVPVVGRRYVSNSDLKQDLVLRETPC